MILKLLDGTRHIVLGRVVTLVQCNQFLQVSVSCKKTMVTKYTRDCYALLSLS